ncbi:MAG: potassium transporter KefB, partial [Proteobacteria bacterium]
SLVGFLITGAIAGPHGLRWLNNLHEVEVLAEIGVIFLLFTVGLELSLGHLLRMKRFVIGAGALQAAGTMLVTFVLMALLSLPYHEAVLIACLVTLSSTAVVLKLLQERGELERPYGRATLGILIFQDFLIIPLMLLLPFLAGESEGGLSSIGLTLLKAAGFVTGVMVAARYVVPKLLFIIVKAKSQELFLVSVAGLCFAVAILAQEVGLSLALGALFAGIIISESEYSNEAFSRIQPFRDVFASLFFVSVGMLIDLSFVVEYPLEIFASFLILIALKIVLAASANVAVGLPLRSALLSGIALAQLGEFSFLLSKEARVLELISEFNYQIFLSCSVLTIASTPFFLRGAPALVDWFLGRSIFQGTIFRALRHELEEEAVSARDIEDHLIIVGFGLNGRNVAKAAENASIPYVISELNPDTVRTERKLGRRIFFGDSAQEDVLKRIGIQRARVLVAAVSEPIATRRIVALARKLNPSIYIIARTRLVAETVPLYKEGANEVVPEEYETSV